MSNNTTERIRWDRGRIHKSVRIYHGNGFKLGESSVVSDDCYIDAQGGIEIGNNTIIGSHTHIYSSEHGIVPNQPIREQPNVRKKTIIGNDVWIGGGVIITGGVTIGNHVIVGAGAVVTHNIPEWEIWAGNPAKKIGDRRFPEMFNKDKNL